MIRVPMHLSAIVVLRAAEASAEIVPHEGARVQHVADEVSGRELLLQRTRPPGPRVDYLESCAGGWDELFPNDSEYAEHPDHGRIWTAEFRSRAQDASQVTMTGKLDSPPVAIERRFSLLASPRRGLRAETAVTANGASGPFLWAAHPMLAVGEGWAVRLPREAGSVRADELLSGRFAPGALLTPSDAASACVVPARASELCEVVYVDGVSSAEVWSADGRSGTRLSWDARALPHLWLVTITGRFGLDDCLLIEPCTSRPYRLDEAIAAGRSVSLSAGETWSAWVEVESLDVA
jgi:hypothetical protein